MGALFRLPCVATDPDTLSVWAGNHEAGTWVTAVDGDPVPRGVRTSPVLLVLGNEGAGVGDTMTARATGRVGIPLQPGAESLNVAIAAGILLYEVLRAD